MTSIRFRPHVPGFVEVDDTDRKEREFPTVTALLNDPVVSRRATGNFAGFSVSQNPPELFDGTPSSMLMAHYANDEYYVVGYLIGDTSKWLFADAEGAPSWDVLPVPSWEEVSKTKTAQPYNPYRMEG